MRCFKCGSGRLMKFIDGFGDKRVFCRGCWGSFLEQSPIELQGQSRLIDFNFGAHYNSKAIIRTVKGGV